MKNTPVWSGGGEYVSGYATNVDLLHGKPTVGYRDYHGEYKVLYSLKSCKSYNSMKQGNIIYLSAADMRGSPPPFWKIFLALQSDVTIETLMVQCCLIQYTVWYFLNFFTAVAKYQSFVEI